MDGKEKAAIGQIRYKEIFKLSCGFYGTGGTTDSFCLKAFVVVILTRPIQIMLLLSLKIIAIQCQIHTIFVFYLFLYFCFFWLSQSCWLFHSGLSETRLLIHLKLNTGSLLNPATECGNLLLLMLKLFSCVITYLLVVLVDIFNRQRLKRASLVATMSEV